MSGGNFGVVRSWMATALRAPKTVIDTLERFIADNSVDFKALEDIDGHTLIGRDAASKGDPQSISVGGNLEFTGSGGIQRGALTGDVTSPAGSNVLTLAPSAKPFGFGFDKDLGAATPSQPFLEVVTQVQYTLAAGLSNSVVMLTAAGTAPSADTAFDLQVGGVSVGSITFAAGAYTAALAMAADHTVTPATTVQIVAPAALNGMTGRLYGSIVGVRG